MAGKRRQYRGGRPFLQLYRNVKRSEAYHSLSVYGRCALFELIDRFSGINNGMIGLGVGELADELDCNKDTAARALKELDDSGLARPLTPGVWRGKRATEWRLTFYRCDKTHELPILNWPVRSQSDRTDPKSDQIGHKQILSLSGRTHQPKNPMNRKPLNPTKPDTCRYTPEVHAPKGPGLPCDYPELPAHLDRRRMH